MVLSGISEALKSHRQVLYIRDLISEMHFTESWGIQKRGMKRKDEGFHDYFRSQNGVCVWHNALFPSPLPPPKFRLPKASIYVWLGCGRPLGSLSQEASVVMQRLSYPTETVLSNKVTRNTEIRYKVGPRLRDLASWSPSGRGGESCNLGTTF